MMKCKIHIKTYIVALLTIISLSSTAWAATYYVDVSGSDSNAGTSQTAAWKTVAKAGSTSVKPGDVVYFKRGCTWNETLKPVSGAAGNPVKYASFGTGVKPVIGNCNITGKSYINIQNIKFNSKNSSHALLIQQNAHDISVEKCDIQGDTTTTAWAALQIDYGAHHNKIIDCAIQRLNKGSSGDALIISRGANHNLIEGNTIGSAIHFALAIDGISEEYSCQYNIIKNNTLNNPIGALMQVITRSDNNVIEGNSITGGNEFKATHSLKSVSKNNIIRNNIIRDNAGNECYGLSSVAYTGSSSSYPNNVTGNRVYNNLITRLIRYPIMFGNYNPTVCSVSNNYYKNNIVYNNDGYQLVISNASNIKDNYFNNNLFYDAGQTKVLQVKGTAYSVAQIESADSTHWRGNKQSDPALASDLNPLPGSPCIDGGDFLTKVTSENGAGATFVVADARYFADGFGIAQGDRIRVGNETGTIKSINYDTNSITLAEQISWQKGVTASLPFAGTRPDIGPSESGLANMVSEPQNLHTIM